MRKIIIVISAALLAFSTVANAQQLDSCMQMVESYIQRADSCMQMNNTLEALQYSKSPYMLYRIALLYNADKDLQNEKKYYLQFLDKIKSVPDLPDAMIQLKEFAEIRLEQINDELFFLGGE